MPTRRGPRTESPNCQPELIRCLGWFPGSAFVGFVAGVLQIAAVAGWLSPPLRSSNGDLITLGPIAIIVGIHLRASLGGGSSRRVVALAVAAIAAEAWWFTMGLLAIGRERPTAGDFGLIWSWAITASWTVGALYFLVAARQRLAPRWVAIPLSVAYVLGLLGNDRLGLTHGPAGDLVQRVAIAGLFLIALAWATLGFDLLLARGLPTPGARARIWVPRAIAGGLLAAIVGGVGFGAARLATLNGSSAGARNELKAAIEDVVGATGVSYQATDDQGHEMDGAKIIAGPGSDSFVALYHSLAGDDTFGVHLATSTDLMNWTWRVKLAGSASMPTIRVTLEGGYFAAWEQEPPNHLKVVYYPTWDALLAGVPTRAFEPPLSLSSCAEGTPNLYVATPTFLDIGFHYYDGCDVDRQARGTSDWTSWSASPERGLEDRIRTLGVAGGVGDRDTVTFRGFDFTVIEGQAVNNDWRTWGVYLVDETAGFAERLDLRTDGASTAFTNPTLAEIEVSGRPALVVTLFVPQEGAHGGEVGELIYYRILDPAPPG